MTLTPIIDAPAVESQLGGRTATIVRWAELSTPLGQLRLYGTPGGLLKIALPNESGLEAEAGIRRLLGAVDLVRDQNGLGAALAQLTAYFAGAARSFSLALDLRGTPFQRSVWEAVARIHYGETRSYRAIAQEVGRPLAVRAVGAANGANPLPIIIPCHRVVGSDGTLTGYSGGMEMKSQLLALEVVRS